MTTRMFVLVCGLAVGATACQTSTQRTNDRSVEQLQHETSNLQVSNVEHAERLAALEARLQRSSQTPAARGDSKVAWPANSRSSAMAWHDAAYPTGDASTSAVGVEKGFPKQITQGAPFEYVVRVTNLSGGTLSNVVVRDYLGKNFQLSGSTPTARQDGTQLRWNLGDLTPGKTQEIRVRGSATGGQSFQSCATVDYATSLCNKAPIVRPALELTKRQRVGKDGNWTKSPVSLTPCDAFAYRYTVSNPGTGDLSNVKVSDRLPAGLQTLEGKDKVTFRVDTLKAGAKKSFVVSLKAKLTGRKASTASAGAGSLRASSPQPVATFLRPKLDIAIKSKSKVFKGRPVCFTVTVRNTGDADARKGKLTIDHPADAKLVKATRQIDGSTWRFPRLRPGESTSIKLCYSPKSVGTLRIAASARARCASRVEAAAQTRVKGIPAILLEVVDEEDPIEIGGQETYIITATNQGSADGTNLRIVASFEDNWSYVGAKGATEASQRGSVVSFAPLSRLAPGKKAVWKVTLKARKDGDTRFRISLTSDQLKREVAETESTNVYE